MSITRPGIGPDIPCEESVECAVCLADLTTARIPARDIETATGLISVCESHTAGDVGRVDLARHLGPDH